MNSQNANEYIAALKQKGAGDQAVIAILRNAAWPEKEAVAALTSYYEGLTGLSVPARPRSIGGPREAFLHLLSFLTLAVWCLAAGSLWFTLIDLWLPDPTIPVFGDPLAFMAWQIACVLVAFPVFLLVMHGIWREMLGEHAQADSSLRRWITYLALLLAAGTLIGDLVAFVEHLLRGEITVRFASKVVTVLVLAGGVFWFYLRTVQPGGEGRSDRLRRYGRVGAVAAVGFVALTLLLSFTKFGTPAAQRLSASDERRSEDLAAIARVIQTRWISVREDLTPTLPKSIDELPESVTLRLADPISGEPYRYVPQSGARYELCASFQTDTRRLPVQARHNQFRVHPAGHYCFAVDAPAAP